MAVPTYGVDRAKLTTESPSAMVDPSKTTGLGQEVASIGEGLAALGAHMEKIRDEQQITAGKNLLSKSLDKIYLEKIKDPDVWGQTDKIDEDYQKAIDSASQNITSSEARDKFQNEAQLIADRKRTSLTMALFNRQSQLYKGTFTDRLDNLQEEYLKSTNLSDQEVLKKEMVAETKNAISIGGVNPAYAQLHLRKVLNDLGLKLLDSDLGLTDNPKALDNIAEEVKKGDSGRYKEIPIEKREQALKSIDRAKTRAEKTEKERIRNVNHIADKTVTWKYANGTLTQEDLFKNATKMTKERYDLLSANLKNNNMASETNPYEFTAMIDFISDEKNSERDCANKILEKENAGKLTPNEAHDLTKMFMVSPDDDPVFKLSQRPNLNQMVEAQDKKNDIHTEKAGWFATLINSIKSHFGDDKKKTSEATKKIMRNYLADNTTARDTREWAQAQAKKVTNEDILQKHPEISKFPKEGKVIGKYRYFPDGSTTLEQ
jgi:hypothetical protein